MRTLTPGTLKIPLSQSKSFTAARHSPTFLCAALQKAKLHLIKDVDEIPAKYKVCE